jgi:hypothetical protein
MNTIILGSSLSLPAHGRAGARATSSLAAHFAKRNTKFGGGGKARAGKNSFPPTPFLFARPSAKVFQNSASGFSLKKVRISFRVWSQSEFGKVLEVASLRSATKLNGILGENLNCRFSILGKENFCKQIYEIRYLREKKYRGRGQASVKH